MISRRASDAAARLRYTVRVVFGGPPARHASVAVTRVVGRRRRARPGDPGPPRQVGRRRGAVRAASSVQRAGTRHRRRATHGASRPALRACTCCTWPAQGHCHDSTTDTDTMLRCDSHLSKPCNLKPTITSRRDCWRSLEIARDCTGSLDRAGSHVLSPKLIVQTRDHAECHSPECHVSIFCKSARMLVFTAMCAYGWSQ